MRSTFTEPGRVMAKRKRQAAPLPKSSILFTGPMEVCTSEFTQASTSVLLGLGSCACFIKAIQIQTQVSHFNVAALRRVALQYMIRCLFATRRGLSSLNALSPLDGRYQSKTAPLAAHFSEAALMRYRILVESQWLLHMLQNGIVKPENNVSVQQTEAELNAILSAFTSVEAEKVKSIEAVTNHDLKSVQYYLKGKVSQYKQHIHFCCTSEDINNLSYALMLKDSLSQVVVPALSKVLHTLIDHSEQWAAHAMLAHTHGQPASPTTLGKQFANFSYRLAQQVRHLKQAQITGKFNGAVGNYNAHYFVFPNIDWPNLSQSFVEQRLGLKFNPYTTQIQPHDSLCRALTEVGASNTILIGLSRDIWEYVSKGYLKQRAKDGEVGSSTMPHKVNPIDFENCQGNLGLANSLIDHFRAKLPISRQQRDLSDSTVLRNQGAALGYSLIAYDSLQKGLGKIDSNQAYMRTHLSSHLEVITEAIQTELRKIGYPQPYELLKNLSRGKAFTAETMDALLLKLKGEVPIQSLQKLASLRPQSYLGSAESLSKQVRKHCLELIA